MYREDQTMATAMIVRKKSLYSEYGVEEVDDFEHFIYHHLEEYAAIQECIKRHGEQAGKKFSLRTIIEMLRNGLDEKYRKKKLNFQINNNMVPLFQRRLEHDRPDLSKYLTKVRRAQGNHKEDI